MSEVKDVVELVEEPQKNELVTIKAGKRIDYSNLLGYVTQTQEKLSKYQNIVVTEETNKEVKTFAASINSEAKEIDALRIKLKKQYMEEWDAFESWWKENITSFYTSSYRTLTDQTKANDAILINAKRDVVVKYFEELKELHGLDFLTFEQLKYNVGLTGSETSHKKKILELVEGIANDLKVINVLDNKERILVKYKQTLNQQQSILQVSQEIEAEKRELERIERLRVEEELRRAKIAETEVRATVQTHEPVRAIPQPTNVMAEEVVSVEEETPGDEQDLQIVVLKLFAKDVNQLRRLKNFLTEEGIRYERVE